MSALAENLVEELAGNLIENFLRSLLKNSGIALREDTFDNGYVTGNNRKVSSEDVGFRGFQTYMLGSHWLVAVCHQRLLCHCTQ